MRREFRILGYPDFTFSGLLNRKCLNLYEAEFHVSGTPTLPQPNENQRILLGGKTRPFPPSAEGTEISPPAPHSGAVAITAILLGQRFATAGRFVI